MHIVPYTGAELWALREHRVAAKHHPKPRELVEQYRVVDPACPCLSELVLSTTWRRTGDARRSEPGVPCIPRVHQVPQWACANGFLIG